MASCGYCETKILFGGKRDGDLRYCNARCQTAGRALVRSHQLSDNVVNARVHEIHSGRCPRCEGPGPVDIARSYRVWSALYVCSWRTDQILACASCRRRAQLGALAFSTFLGWWSLHGVLITPVQIGRNLSGLFREQDPLRPSPGLERQVRVQLGSALPAI